MAFTSLNLPKLCIIYVAIAGQNFKALLDSGSQCSLITESAVRKAGMIDKLLKRSIPAASWANEKLEFTGQVTLPLNIAECEHEVSFYTCVHLATRTDLILGLDWLKQNCATMTYLPGKVRFFLEGVEIPLIESGQECQEDKEHIPVYTLGKREDLHWAVVAQDTTIESLHCMVVKINLPDLSGGETIHCQHRDFQDLEVPSQIARV